jgi:hypothetical protein
MKSVWRLVIPMLKCWKVLTPLKFLDGLEDVINKLEALAWRLERSCHTLTPDAGF